MRTTSSMMSGSVVAADASTSRAANELPASVHCVCPLPSTIASSLISPEAKTAWRINSTWGGLHESTLRAAKPFTLVTVCPIIRSVRPIDQCVVMATSASPCFCSQDVSQSSGTAVSKTPTTAANHLYR
jgi:hypothetical protein